MPDGIRPVHDDGIDADELVRFAGFGQLRFLHALELFAHKLVEFPYVRDFLAHGIAAAGKPHPAELEKRVAHALVSLARNLRILRKQRRAVGGAGTPVILRLVGGEAFTQPEPRGFLTAHFLIRQLTIGIARLIKAFLGKRAARVLGEIRIGVRGENHKRRACTRQTAPARACHNGCGEKEDRGKQGPLEKFDHDPPLSAFHFEGIEPLGGHAHHPRDIRTAPGDHVAPAGLVREFAQHIGLQAAEDAVAGRIHQTSDEIRVGNKPAVLRAHAYGDDRNTRPLRIGDDRIKFTLVLFPIADEDERIVFLSRLLEHLRGEPHRRSDVRSTRRHPLLIDLFHRFPDGGMIDG